MVTYGVIFLSRLQFRACHSKRLSALAMAGLVWLASGLSASAADTQSIDREAFLRAIAQVETGGNSRAVGRSGERGMYQFGRLTWRQHTKRPHADAHNAVVARGIAERHFEWLHAGLLRNGRQPTPYLMAAAWNAGLARTVGGRLPASTRDYASRVTNIVAATTPRPATVVAAVEVQAPSPVQAATRYFVATIE